MTLSNSGDKDSFVSNLNINLKKHLCYLDALKNYLNFAINGIEIKFLLGFSPIYRYLFPMVQDILLFKDTLISDRPSKFLLEQISLDYIFKVIPKLINDNFIFPDPYREELKRIKKYRHQASFLLDELLKSPKHLSSIVQNFNNNEFIKKCIEKFREHKKFKKHDYELILNYIETNYIDLYAYLTLGSRESFGEETKLFGGEDAPVVFLSDSGLVENISMEEIYLRGQEKWFSLLCKKYRTQPKKRLSNLIDAGVFGMLEYLNLKGLNSSPKTIFLLLSYSTKYNDALFEIIDKKIYSEYYYKCPLIVHPNVLFYFIQHIGIYDANEKINERDKIGVLKNTVNLVDQTRSTFATWVEYIEKNKQNAKTKPIFKEIESIANEYYVEWQKIDNLSACPSTKKNKRLEKILQEVVIDSLEKWNKRRRNLSTRLDDFFNLILENPELSVNLEIKLRNRIRSVIEDKEELLSRWEHGSLVNTDIGARYINLMFNEEEIPDANVLKNINILKSETRKKEKEKAWKNLQDMSEQKNWVAILFSAHVRKNWGDYETSLSLIDLGYKNAPVEKQYLFEFLKIIIISHKDLPKAIHITREAISKYSPNSRERARFLIQIAYLIWLGHYHGMNIEEGIDDAIDYCKTSFEISARNQYLRCLRLSCADLVLLYLYKEDMKSAEIYFSKLVSNLKSLNVSQLQWPWVFFYARGQFYFYKAVKAWKVNDEAIKFIKNAKRDADLLVMGAKDISQIQQDNYLRLKLDIDNFIKERGIQVK